MTGSRVAAVCAVGIGFWAVFVLCWNVGTAPLLVDEPTYANAGWNYIESMLGHSSHLSNFEHPPLAKLLFGVSEHLVGHPSITAARVVAVICTLLTVALIGWWIASIAGRWHGVAAAALVALVPTPIWPQVTDFGRTAMLDPVAELFMVASVVAAWFWLGAPRGRPWLWAALTGIATGLAVASKENGFLGVLGPVAIGLFLHRGRRRAAQAALATATTVVTVLLTYLPVGDPFGHAAMIVRFQWHHRVDGHLVGVGNHLTDHPPWWANLWFAEQSWGLVLSLSVLACAAAGALKFRDRLTVWMLAALAGPVIFHCMLARVALLFYWVMWTPALLAMAGRGLVALASSRRTVIAAALAVAVAGQAAVTQTVTVATLHVEGPQAAKQVRAELGLHGRVAVTGTSFGNARSFLGWVLTAMPSNVSAIDTVLIGTPRCRTLFDPEIRALVTANVANGRMHLAHHDRLLDVYVADAPLIAPTAEQIAAQPLSRLTDNC